MKKILLALALVLPFGASAACTDLKSDLQLGAGQGTSFTEVKQLQLFLKNFIVANPIRVGYYNIQRYPDLAITGFFDRMTKISLSWFQQSNKLASSGVADASTRALIKSATCGQGKDIPVSLLDLLDDRVGFGRNATGGAAGKLYHVTTLADSGLGSLRAALESSEALWIVFDLNGTININSELFVRSNKTIDGRGKKITLKINQPFRFYTKDDYGGGSANIIVENISLENNSNADVITMKWGTKNVWVDHVTAYDSGKNTQQDGLIDMTRGSTDITISWSKFYNHSKVMLIGHSAYDDNEPNRNRDIALDREIRVTLHHNFFDQTTQRHPRLRFGKVHAYNNYLNKWKYFGMSSAMEGQLYSEKNIFEADSAKNAIESKKGQRAGLGNDSKGGYAESDGDWFLNGARAQLSGESKVFKPREMYSYTASPANDALRNIIRNEAGAK